MGIDGNLIYCLLSILFYIQFYYHPSTYSTFSEVWLSLPITNTWPHYELYCTLYLKSNYTLWNPSQLVEAWRKSWWKSFLENLVNSIGCKRLQGRYICSKNVIFVFVWWNFLHLFIISVLIKLYKTDSILEF